MGAGVKNWLWDKANKIWRPALCDDTGRMSIKAIVDYLNDIGDVDVAAPGDGHVLYWDDAAGKWKDKLISATKIVDADGDTYVTVEKTADKDTIEGYVKDVLALMFHDDGILDLPKQSGCHAYLSSPYDAPDGWGKVPLDAEIYDIQSEFNTTTSIWTAKKTGTYVVALRGATDIGVTVPDGTKSYVRVWINGAVGPISAAFMVSKIDTASASFAFVYRFTIGDEVEMYFSQNSGAAKAMGTGFQATFMEIAKIA